MKTVLLLFILTIACNHNTYQLPEKIKENYNILSKKKSVTGSLHYIVCEEENIERLKYLRDISSKQDLLWMLDNSSEKAFKLFLIEEIHRKYPELDTMLLSKYGNDSTMIDFNTSCFGIFYKKELGEVCKNIIKLNAFDKLTVPKNIKIE